MNSTMFFNPIEPNDQKVLAMTKRGNAAYSHVSTRTHQTANNESNPGLYRPISPITGESFSSYGYRNSPSPGKDGNEIKFVQTNYSHLNGQTLVFEKFPHITQEVFDNSNNIHHHSTDNMSQNTFNNNNNNRHHNNNYGYSRHHNSNGSSGRTRSRYQNNQPDTSSRDERRKPLNSGYRYGYGQDAMIKRAHGLTHRFISRSDIMKIDPNPSQLLTGGSYDQLNQAIYDVFTSRAQMAEVYENKIQLWNDLFLYIRGCVSHYALYIVGSTMTGFGLDTSDIDMCLLIRPCTEDPRLDSLQQLHHIKNHLLKCGLIGEPELILAKVPILKFRENSTGFEIDLNCNNSVGIYNTNLLYCYSRCDWRVRPLVVMVKLWAQANRINDAKNLTVSSYSWTLMVINYLQCGVTPQILPCLHILYPERFNTTKSKITDVHEHVDTLEDFHSFNMQSLAELFIGFFGYYANFDFSQYAISVRAGGPVLIESCKQMKAPKNDHNQWKYLCIEEPFDFTNTARSVYDIAAFRHIKDILRRSYEELLSTKVLNGVLPVNFDAAAPLLHTELSG